MVIKPTGYQTETPSRSISFSGYLTRTPVGIQPASNADIQSYWNTMQEISNSEIQNFEHFAQKALLSYQRDSSYSAVNNFINLVRAEQKRYENEKFAELSQLINDPQYHVLLSDEDGFVFADQRLGDNCYEFATKDYYENALRRLYWNQTTVPTGSPVIVTISSNYRHPYFLQPGFTNGWTNTAVPPLFCTDQNTWNNNYNPMRNNSSVSEAINKIRASVVGDARTFRMNCAVFDAFDRQTYVSKANTTLIFGIVGITSLGPDHHWYRFFPEYGLWVHKPGLSPITCFDANGNLIFNPSDCAYSYQRAYPIGYFELNPLA